MKDKNIYEFKGSTVDDAIATGLKELGLTIDQVDIEKKSYGGIFSKACVVITPKQVEEATEEAPITEDNFAEAPVEEQEEVGKTTEEIEKIAESSTEFIKGLLEKMNVYDCSVNTTVDGKEINISVDGENAGHIIGYRGEALDAIQYITLVLANKGEKEFVRIQLDAGTYRKKRKETLASLAERLAQKATRTGRPVSLEPMNPFERRVIHTTLAERTDVTTKSEGEGRLRHVVIVPTNTVKYEYGNNNNFRRKGPGKTRSFGYKDRRF